MTTKEKMGKIFSNRKKVEILVPNKKKKEIMLTCVFSKTFALWKKL